MAEGSFPASALIRGKGLYHNFISDKADGEDASLVNASDWNEGHVGIVPESQLATGTPTAGRVPVATATGQAAWGSLGEWTTITKSLDEDVSGTTTFQDDDELLFTTVADAYYRFEAYIIYSSPAGGGTPDIRYNLGEDGTSRGTLLSIGMTTGDAATATSAISNNLVAVTHGTAATPRQILVVGHCRGAGGTFAFRWAQGTSNANATRVHAGSYLRYTRVL